MLSERAYSRVGSTYARHYETSGIVRAPMDKVFAYLDDHVRLASHMSKSSWMMAGSSMQVELDSASGQKVGSLIRLSGRVLGVRLAVEAIVTERAPPRHKVWETVGVPRLLVIGHYRMGFNITPCETGSDLTIFIDYALPDGALMGWFGYLLGDYYARWCTRRMISDAVKNFGANVEIIRHQKEVVMNRLLKAAFFTLVIGGVPLMAQEKKDMPMKGQMPMKEGMPMKGEGMQGMPMANMKEMHGKMMEMKKGMGGMMKGQGMMKSDDMKGMGGMMGDMSSIMGNMGQMMGGGKMTPEEMAEMSKMMGDMSGMMKQMSERMGRGAKKPQ